MINSLLVCDTSDTHIGSFLEKCKIQTLEILNSVKNIFQIDEISGKIVFDIIVPLKAKSYNNSSFLFISYTHGSKTELLQNGITPFISDKIETACLKNSFSYCFACKAGSILGKTICNIGALSFIGYNKAINIQKYFGAEDYFIDCAVSGIKAFIEGKTTEDVLKYIKEKYNESIDEFYQKDMLTSSLFMDNRDALVLHGNKKLTINDF